MKLIRVGVIAATLLLSSLGAKPQARLAEPQPVEYNLGFCGGESFTVVHAVLSADGKSLNFTHHLSDPQTVVKDEGQDHLTFAVKIEPKDKDGNQKYSAQAKYGDAVLTVDGFIHGNRIIGLQKVDGELGHVLYGQVGKVDEMVKDVQDDIQVCVDVHSVDLDQIPQVIVRWLLNAAPENPSLNKT